MSEQEKKQSSVAEVLVKCLENEGVKYVFGIPGEENLDMMNALEKSDIRVVVVRHEQGAAFMADMYGRLTGKAGVCFSTLGPGATNLITGTADANSDGAPLIAITGQVGTERMHLTSHQYLDLVERIRTAIPDISLTTDIIVGFPGETEEDFQETLDVVAKCGYDTAFTFLYSKRSDTPAAAMENQVPQDVAKERFNRLLALVQNEGRKRSSRFEGSVQEVLVEEESKEKGIFTGRTQYNLLVHFAGDESLLGKYVKVHLDECKGFYYLGTLEENE